jgi:hypothetical protein
MIPKKELKRIIDFKNYINKCVSNNSEINNDTIKKYLKEDFYFKKYDK